MNHTISSEDREFKKIVERYAISVADFDHRAHLRLAYVYLVESKVNIANNKVRQTLCGLLRHNNIEPASKYHETLTQSWLLAVNRFMKSSNNCCSADEFIKINPTLLDSQIMMTHYSREVLFSEKASKVFVEPDLKAIAS